MEAKHVTTSHGDIAYWDTGGDGLTVVFIHGNSGSKRIFERQMSCEGLQPYRLVAVDLPGHGESGKAHDPQATYFINGFATALLEAFEQIDIGKAIFVGWSLGGHIALELMARWDDAAGAFIFGAPPIPNDPERALSAFKPGDLAGLPFTEKFDEALARAFVSASFADAKKVEPWMVEDALRTDGRFRPISLQGAMEGRNLDEEQIVGACPHALAVLHGEQDSFVEEAFLSSVTYRNLWQGKVHVIGGVGHTPQWEAADEFNELLTDFCGFCR